MRNGSGPRRPKPPLGKHIKRARTFLRMTQEEFGAVLDASERTVQRWELGGTRPSAKVVRQLIAYVALRDAAFATELRTLLTGEPPPVAPPPPSADALMDAVREAADQLDVPASRARAAFVAFLERLEAERFTVETARAALGRVNGEGREDGVVREDRERTEAPPGQAK